MRITNEEKRVLIARHLGWRIDEAGRSKAAIRRGELKFYDFGLKPGTKDDYCKFPDYLTDLNAMHEAEKAFTSGDQWVCYYCHLDSICEAEEAEPRSATASQRAEAFGKSMELW